MAIHTPAESAYPGDDYGDVPFLLEVRAGEDDVRIGVFGQLDLATAPDLRQLAQALAGTVGPVTLDLAGLTFIDSTGISALASFKGEMDLQLRHLTVRNVPERVLDVLKMVGVDEALGICT